MEDEVSTVEGQKCPMCPKDALTLSEIHREIPYFGSCFLFSMNCNECGYHKSDVECEEKHEPAKYTFEISSEEDLKVRVVKSSEAKVVIPRIMTWEPGDAAQGFITNIEGLLNRAKRAIEQARDAAEDNDDKKKCKNMIKKLQKVLWGQEKMKITIEDPTGNSAIVSDKAEKKKIKGK